MRTMQSQARHAPVRESDSWRHGWRRKLVSIMGVVFVGIAGNLHAQTRCSSWSLCGSPAPCQRAPGCPSLVQAAPTALHYYCPMYATQQLEGGGGFLYYALEWDLSCNSSTPVPMTGNYTTPRFCPNCDLAYTMHAADAQRSSLTGVGDFPGYPGQIRRENFNPVTARPDDGGFPDTPGWARPTLIDEKLFRFTDSFGRTVYIKVFTVSLKVREACKKQHNPHCEDMPEYYLAKIGYQVVPDDPNNPDYLPVAIDPIARKLVRAYTGLNSNKQESALVILARGF